MWMEIEYIIWKVENYSCNSGLEMRIWMQIKHCFENEEDEEIRFGLILKKTFKNEIDCKWKLNISFGKWRQACCNFEKALLAMNIMVTILMMVTALVPVGDLYGHGLCASWWPLWSRPLCQLVTFMVTALCQLVIILMIWTTTTTTTTSTANWNYNCNSAVDCIVWELEGETMALFATWSYWNKIFKAKQEGEGKIGSEKESSLEECMSLGERWSFEAGQQSSGGERGENHKDWRIAALVDVQNLTNEF